MRRFRGNLLAEIIDSIEERLSVSRVALRIALRARVALRSQLLCASAAAAKARVPNVTRKATDFLANMVISSPMERGGSLFENSIKRYRLSRF